MRWLTISRGCSTQTPEWRWRYNPAFGGAALVPSR
jgi:hypothetical protein